MSHRFIKIPTEKCYTPLALSRKHPNFLRADVKICVEYLFLSMSFFKSNFLMEYFLQYFAFILNKKKCCKRSKAIKKPQEIANMLFLAGDITGQF